MVPYSALNYDAFHRRFAKHLGSGAEGSVGRPATVDAIERCEKRLGVSLPPAVREMYLSFDGLKAGHPPFVIYPLEGIVRDENLLVFSICDQAHQLAFDTRELNRAAQWFIVNADTGYRITYTIASFLSTRMWSWVEKERPIWRDFHGERAAG
jgi:hypothetical protein